MSSNTARNVAQVEPNAGVATTPDPEKGKNADDQTSQND